MPLTDGWHEIRPTGRPWRGFRLFGLLEIGVPSRLPGVACPGHDSQ